MKKSVLVFLVILAVSMAAAGYECSQGETLSDKDQIALHEVSSVNGIKIGLMKAHSYGSLGRYYADLMIDASVFTLTDIENTTDFEIAKGNNTIELTNISGDLVKVEIDGDSDEIEEGESNNVKGFQVYVWNLEGSFPNESAIVNGLIGDEIFRLDQETPAAKAHVKGVEYAVELFSVSDEEVIVEVKKCESNEITMILVEEPEVNESVNVSGENESVEAVENASEELKESVGIENESNTEQEGISAEEKDEVASWVSVGVIGGLITGILVFVIYLLFKFRGDRKKEEQLREERSQITPEGEGSVNDQDSQGDREQNYFKRESGKPEEQ